jgi:hypothetical protein
MMFSDIDEWIDALPGQGARAGIAHTRSLQQLDFGVKRRGAHGVGGDFMPARCWNGNRQQECFRCICAAYKGSDNGRLVQVIDEETLRAGRIRLLELVLQLVRQCTRLYHQQQQRKDVAGEFGSGFHDGPLQFCIPWFDVLGEKLTAYFMDM